MQSEHLGTGIVACAHSCIMTCGISLICGHEIIGEVIALGASFYAESSARPQLYSTLKIGDKVVSPFTVSCGECQYV